MQQTRRPRSCCHQRWCAQRWEVSEEAEEARGGDLGLRHLEPHPPPRLPQLVIVVRYVLAELVADLLVVGLGLLMARRAAGGLELLWLARLDRGLVAPPLAGRAALALALTCPND